MKFGRFLEVHTPIKPLTFCKEQRQKQDDDWADHCINYTTLKLIIKNSIASVIDPLEHGVNGIGKALEQRLDALKKPTAQFFDLLENVCFISTISSSIANKGRMWTSWTRLCKASFKA